MDRALVEVVCLANYLNDSVKNSRQSKIVDSRIWPDAGKVPFIKSKWLFFHTVASDPDAWLKKQAQTARRAWIGYRATKLNSPEAHNSVAFLGGGPGWMLFIDHGETVEYWEPVYFFGRKFGRGRQLKEKFVGRTIPVQDFCVGPTVSMAEKEINEALLMTEKFAREEGLSFWAEHFARARNLSPREPSFTALTVAELSPPGFLSPESVRLLELCIVSWVFGGMGTWNDFAFNIRERHELYQSLSSWLFFAVCDGFCAATNQFATTQNRA